MNYCTNKIQNFFIPILVIISLESSLAQRNEPGEDQNKEWRTEYFFTEGEKFYLLEDYAKSLESFQKAYDLSPNNPAVNYKLAQISAKAEDNSKALFYINKSITGSPENKYYYLLASELHTRNGDFDSASETYKKMIESIPGTDEYLFELAAIYLYDRKLDLALKTYNQIESKLGVSEESSFQKQKIYLDQNKTDLAIAEMEKLIRTFPDEPSYHARLGEMLLSSNKTEEAIALLKTVINDYPHYSRARLMLSDAYEKNGELELSRQNLMIAFEDPALDSNLKLQILNTYRAGDRGNRDFVIELTETIARAHPENPTIKVVLGDINLEYDNKEVALSYYLEAVEIDPSVFNVWDNILKLEYGLNRIESVIKHSEEAMELFPNQYSPYFFNGVANIRSKNFDEGIYAVNETKKRTSDPGIITQCNLLLGDAYFELKEYQKSDQFFETVIASDPDNNSALNNYSYYLSLRKANLNRAKELSSRLIANNPDNPTYLDTHAWVLFQKEEYEEARKIIEKAIRSPNANAIHFEHYGDILFKLGKEAEAVEQWKQAKKLNSNSELIDKKIADRKLYN
ncbi:MAG TPA: tetratricopeptide repeat protein [Cyclobacteriaceae bacterium]|jgi:tetratricopeptide (TPR) repeat protein